MGDNNSQHVNAAAPRGARTRARGLIGTAAAGVALGAGAAIATRALGKRARRPRPSGWYAVTVAAEPGTLTGPERPDLLAWLAEHHETRITPAPAGRGSQIAVRTDDGEIRERVRALKQLLETGEVLRMEGRPEGHRTPLGRLGIPVMRQLTRRGTR
ncbi:hypothetical protein ACTMTF_18220 [Nonomuraea sp. ZG12]|uniref:hypothetical protein n=1 Tax=Nonomuraea sp. ZG12 TaxID=3452207 RepID=UPI003F8AE6D0